MKPQVVRHHEHVQTLRWTWPPGIDHLRSMRWKDVPWYFGRDFFPGEKSTQFSVFRDTLRETKIAGWKMDPDWRCISYWKWGFSMAMLVYPEGMYLVFGWGEAGRLGKSTQFENFSVFLICASVCGFWLGGEVGVVIFGLRGWRSFNFLLGRRFCFFYKEHTHATPCELVF